MQVDIQNLLGSAGLKDPVYPGKKLVKKYQQPGQYKSHCVVFDWKDTEKLHIELKAGLTGRSLDPSDLKNYPVSFQAPTYVDIKIENDNKDPEEDDEEEEGSKGKSSGGGKKPAKKKLEESRSTLKAFDKAKEGIIPGAGEITKFVVMGKEIAAEAYATAFENLKEQLHQTKVMVMEIMKGVSDVIKRATPGGGLEAKGNESIPYKYDSEKTAPLFGGMAPS